MSEVTIKGVQGQLTVSKDKLSIEPKGLLGFANHGLKGKKTIFFKNLSGIQHKRASWLTNGYIQFSFMGGTESKGGLLSAVKDENTFMFKVAQQGSIDSVVAYIEERIAGNEAELPMFLLGAYSPVAVSKTTKVLGGIFGGLLVLTVFAVCSADTEGTGGTDTLVAAPEATTSAEEEEAKTRRLFAFIQASTTAELFELGEGMPARTVAHGMAENDNISCKNGVCSHDDGIGWMLHGKRLKGMRIFATSSDYCRGFRLASEADIGYYSEGEVGCALHFGDTD
jgi:hypothetical protein